MTADVPSRVRGPRRVAMISVHTSPLDQPGTGDAGGLNVYVVETAKRLAARGVEVEIFTRATSATLPETVEMVPGVTVRHIIAGPYEGLHKEDLPGQLCAFAAGVMRSTAARPERWFDVIHSHYWLSGQVGWLMMDRWNVPLVHTMHTMARVKNAQLAEGDRPEPPGREIGEVQVVEAASRLVANTQDEADDLIRLYDADPAKVRIVTPGVDLELFRPGSAAERAADRAEFGFRDGEQVLLFVGRIQPLKAPDVLVKAVGEVLRREPERRGSLRVVICGGPSGSGMDKPTALQDLAAELGLKDVVDFRTPVPRETLARLYRAADAVAVPSHNESFGLVAAEAQATGTPVIAAAVGGLVTVVGEAGVLVDSHDPARWADALTGLLADPAHLAGPMRDAAAAQGARFSWEHSADLLVEAYAEACLNCSQRAAS